MTRYVNIFPPNVVLNYLDIQCGCRIPMTKNARHAASQWKFYIHSTTMTSTMTFSTKKYTAVFSYDTVQLALNKVKWNYTDVCNILDYKMITNYIMSSVKEFLDNLSYSTKVPIFHNVNI